LQITDLNNIRPTCSSDINRTYDYNINKAEIAASCKNKSLLLNVPNIVHNNLNEGFNINNSDSDSDRIFDTINVETNDVHDNEDENMSYNESDNNEQDNFYDDAHDFTDATYLKNVIMFEASNTSAWEVFNMVQAIALRFNFSQEAKHAVLEFARILAGSKFANFKMTKYSISKLFNPPQKCITYVFYCSQCGILLNDTMLKSDVEVKKCIRCTKCQEDYTLSISSTNYFLSIDMEYQLRSLLEDENIEHLLQKNDTS
jgi:hypothetical protein